MSRSQRAGLMENVCFCSCSAVSGVCLVTLGSCGGEDSGGHGGPGLLGGQEETDDLFPRHDQSVPLKLRRVRSGWAPVLWGLRHCPVSGSDHTAPLGPPLAGRQHSRGRLRGPCWTAFCGDSWAVPQKVT